MTATELTVVIASVASAVVIVIKAIADAFRHQKIEYRAEASHNDLVQRSEATVVTLDAIKTQTNGQTTTLQNALAAALMEIGQLKGMVAGIQTQRGVRSTDPVQPVPVILVPPLPAIAPQAAVVAEPLRVPLDEDDRRPR